MKRNVGGLDRAVRIIAGVILILVGFGGWFSGWGAIAAYVIGAVVLLTGIIGFCGAYPLLGINTCKPKQEPKRTA